MDQLAIETRNLRKTFGGKVAVEDLSLGVRRGEVFGFLGPNGAGKSTSVKMLLGLISASAGEARVLGRPAGDVCARAKMGFLPEHFRFHDWLTGEEFLRLHGRLYGMPAARLRERAGALLELVGLAPHAGKRLKDFSKGMLQRIGLAQALLNDPELVFLDEPTSGLDPVGRRLVRDIIRDQRSRGTTVFLNSHLLSEVEITCDRVAFIKHGKVLDVRRMGSLAPGEMTVTARVSGLCPDAARGLEQWARSVRIEGERLAFEVDSEEALPDVLAYLVSSGARVYSFRSEQVSLEDLFLDIVGTDGGL
jgi:ABC-2 type transport system ATP-binding protein